MKRLILISVNCLIFFSLCSHPKIMMDCIMDDAESVLNDHPDSAFCLLETVDTVSQSRAQLARLSLLKSIAVDKMYIDTTDLSLIKPAVDYYMRHGSPEQKMKTMYYLGRIQYNAHDYTSALISFIKAKEYSEQTDDNRMKGMICSFLGATQNSNYNNKDELNYFIEEYSWFCKSGDTTDIDNARYLLSVAYHNNRLFNQSDSIAKTIGKDSRFYGMGVLIQAVNAITVSKDSADRALTLFNKAKDMDVAFDLDNWYQYAYCLLLTGQDAACSRMMNHLQQYPTDARSGWWKYAIAVNQGDTKQALLFLEDYSKQCDTLIRARLGQSLHKAEADYYSGLAEQEKQKRKDTGIALVITGLLAVIIIMALVTLFQKKQLAIKAEKNEILSKYIAAQKLLSMESQNNLETEERERKIKQLQFSFAQMYRSYFAKFGAFYNKNLEYSLIEDRGQQVLLKQLSAVFSELSSNNGDFGQWESRVNSDLDNIILKLRADYPELSENDYLFLSFVIVGFEPITIAAILNANDSTVRSRKRRLKTKVFSKTTPNTPLYEAFIV